MWRRGSIHQKLTNTFHTHYSTDNQDLVNEISKLLKHNHWKKLINTSEIPSKLKLNHDVIPSILHQNRDGDPKKLVSFFQWCQQNVGFQSNLHILSFLAISLCNSNFYGPSCKTIDRLISTGVSSLELLDLIARFRDNRNEVVKFNPLVFQLLISRYIEDGRLVEAASLFLCNSEFEFSVDMLCCNLLLRDLLKANELGLFWEVCNNAMSEGNYKFDEFTYNNMIKAHCKAGNVNDAKELLYDMERKGILPSMVAYSVVIGGLCKAGFLSEAVKMKETMVSKGIKPANYTYAPLILGLYAANRFEEARMMLAEMEDIGIKPDVVTCQALFNVLMIEGNPEKAGRFEGACEAARMDEARKLLDEMIRIGVMPDSTNYAILIEGYCREKDMTSAFELYSEMKKRNLELPVKTYDALIVGLCGCGKLQMACAILDEMISKNLEPTDVIRKTILNAYAREGGTEGIKRVLEQ